MSMFCTEFQTGRNSRLENDGQISGFRVFRCRCGETVLKDHCPAKASQAIFPFEILRCRCHGNGICVSIVEVVVGGRRGHEDCAADVASRGSANGESLGSPMQSFRDSCSFSSKLS